MKAPPEKTLASLGLTATQYLELRAVAYIDAVQRARNGEWRPYFEFQWPELILDDFQQDGLDSIFNPTIHSVWMKGNTGCGKGAFAGLTAAAHLDIWSDSLIRNTASTFQQGKDSVFKETVTWMNRMYRKPPTLIIKSDEIRDDHPLRREHNMQVSNPKTEQAFAGRHAEHTLFILDEATELDEGTFDIAETQAKKLLVMGNPRTLSGKFRNAFGFVDPNRNQTVNGQYGLKRLITVDGKFTMNVRMKCLRSATAPKGGIVICPKRGDATEIMDLPPEEWVGETKLRGGRYFSEGKEIPQKWRAFCKPIIPGQNDYGWFIGLMSHPREFNRMVFGRARFPEQDPEKQVILGSWLERCTKCHSEHKDKLTVAALGIDVGYQEDLPCMVSGCENGFLEVLVPEERITKTERLLAWIQEVCGRRYKINIFDGSIPLAVDMDGPGKGLVDILAAAGAWVIAIQSGSSSTIDTQRYLNLRAAMYGALGERLDPGGPEGHTPFALPYDPQLLDELQWPEKIPVGHDGLKHRLTPKTEIRKDKGRSPDRADAAVYCYHAIREVCDSGSVAVQFDTSTFVPDYSWKEGLVTSMDLSALPVAVVTGEKTDYDSAKINRELRSLKMMQGFSPEEYRNRLRRIATEWPDTEEGRRAEGMLAVTK